MSVYNYANFGKVNGFSTNNSTILCGRQTDNESPEKLTVAPCFLPNIFGGPYWIVAVGPDTNNYEWAIISGGQPSVRITNNTCTTKIYGFNAGLWLFSRKPILESSKLEYLRKILYKKGISSSKLLDVKQEGCNYTNAFIK